ncbi:alpha/beta hydrolase [Mesorhizobium sp. ZC-5]|nr:alpha/beta hydrolase [Mesorhizobium sp. ZC-5]MCV3243406.1 alpha/beta hydrolase [Mesorhizobium sp. ZC-5]
MPLHRIVDWDNAYANGPNIAGGERWPDLWIEPAERFRARMKAQGRARLDQRYGQRPRNLFDLFLPEGTPKGLVVFVHGGFWLRLDKSFWSHLATGPLAHGHAVAMPSYTLCPEIRIAGIVREVAAAIGTAAAMVEGPMRLTGHSAGGHLVTRMITSDVLLPPSVQDRVVNTVSISGVHDLRPLMRTVMNKQLRIDETEANVESPVLLRPIEGARLTCWVGGAERAEFRRQNALLGNVWAGLGAATDAVEEPDRHHFDVIDGLVDRNHPLTRTLVE